MSISDDEGVPRPPQNEFESAFDLLSLGENDAARIDRLERIMGGYLAAAMKYEGNFMTLRAERLPIPSRESVESIIDEFTDPETVKKRDQWRRDNPDLND